ncbi:hypothetical protein CSUI_005989 [Cystoisospora suis]|uniref:Uncharacterized protein n=1 Tax=Cystoisospora suis TaxID=483139 RepID=A0A2C6KI52_9APIC|nr:hypothetical protein CSUI_005989 [Cystoisospora suis]
MKISFISSSSSSSPPSPLASSSPSLITSPSTRPFSPSFVSPHLLTSPVLLLSLSELIEGILPFRFHLHLKVLPSSSTLLRQQLLLPSLHLLALQQDLLYRLQHDLLTLEKQNASEDPKRKESLREENQQVHERLLRLVRRTLSGLLPPVFYHYTLMKAYEEKGSSSEKGLVDFLPSLSSSERRALDLFAPQNACKVAHKERGKSPCLTRSPQSDEDHYKTSRESSQTRPLTSPSSSSSSFSSSSLFQSPSSFSLLRSPCPSSRLRSPSSSTSSEEISTTLSNSYILSSSSSFPLIFSWMPSTVAAYGAITARYLPTSSEVLSFNDLFNLRHLSQSLLLPSTTTLTLEKYERSLSRRDKGMMRKSEDSEDRLPSPLEDIVLYSDKRGINSSLSPYRRKQAEALTSDNPNRDILFEGRSASLHRERSDRGRLKERGEEGDVSRRKEEEDTGEMSRTHDHHMSREGVYEDEREREGEEASYLDEDERRKNRKREKEIQATKIIVSGAESRRRRRLI